MTEVNKLSEHLAEDSKAGELVEDESELQDLPEDEPEPQDFPEDDSVANEWTENDPEDDEFEDDDFEDENPEDDEPFEMPEDNSEQLVKELSKAEKGMKNAQWFLIYLVVFLLVAWILFFKIIGITHMPSADMEPRVDAGDLLVFFRLDKDAQFRDIVVFEKDIDGSGKKTMIVGRVMAAPGDTVDINDSSQLVVNGNVIVETQKYVLTAKRGDRITYPVTLADGEYFILSDNREDGVDSRYFGPVTRDEILGTVITLIRRNKL